ncbi:hypothetical protein GCM10010307_17690 [Streptomyces vastus]|uniref:Uncharacterized protein n=1 Tax=Streptomyces vastus TaxID=285451 RepID=A0ABN3QJD5_9ACTN
MPVHQPHADPAAERLSEPKEPGTAVPTDLATNTRPLPLHLAKLAEEYFLPLSVAPTSAPVAGQGSE